MSKQGRIIQDKIKILVGFRGTKEEIIEKLKEIGTRNDPILEPFEHQSEENDWGFNVNLGESYGDYFDFEIFMLPTREKDVWLITEINPF